MLFVLQVFRRLFLVGLCRVTGVYSSIIKPCHDCQMYLLEDTTDIYN